MISFLIPIYNRDVTKFITELYNQCETLDVPFEILCYDDCSEEKYKEINRSLSEKVGVSYMEMSQNLGRSKIRNWLGKNARYDQLVFMDCDSEIVSNAFAKSYVNAIGKDEIIYGGTAYQKGRPEKTRLLHWKYGRSVESQSLKKRLQNPFMSFRSNNFMIARWVFVKHLFDTTIDGYGFEDNVFAEGLKEAKYNIWHIDNPLLHDGLETNEAFLNKTNQALDNLAKLYQEKKLKTRLTKTYDRWKDNGFLSLFNFLNKFSRKKRYQRLLNNKTGLMSFQLYKLDYFMNLVKDDK